MKAERGETIMKEGIHPNYKHTKQRKTFVLKFVQSVILSLQASRSLLIQVDVLTDLTSVLVSRTNKFWLLSDTKEFVSLINFTRK